MSSEAEGEPPGEGGGAPVAGIVGVAGDTHAQYLTKCLIADRGYVAGTFPEAAPLAEAVDYVVTGGDGVGLAIACIVDRERDPEKRFTMDPARVDELAAACRHHAGSMHGVRDSVVVEIWEIGPGVPDADDRRRLEAYTFRQVTQKGVGVKTYAVDTRPAALGDLVSTAADGSVKQPWVRKVLKEPRRIDAELAYAAEQRQKVARFTTRPVATLALLAAFVIVFVATLAWTVMPADGFLSPHLTTLIASGALEHAAVEAGEWWRMLTCAFLHGNLLHLLFNGVAMYMAGGVLENLVGRRWMLALFVVGAVGGSAASLAINPASMASVGASGAIMAMLAAAMVLSLRLPKGPARTQILASLGYILVPSVLPIFEGANHNTDYAAHIGGAVTGAITGGLLLLTWRREAPRPRAPHLAAAIAAVGFVLTAYGFVRAAQQHDESKLLLATRHVDPESRRLLVPDERRPPTDEAWKEQIELLLAEFPRDPRVNYIAAEKALEADDVINGQRYLDRVLAERKLIGILFGTDSNFEIIVRYRLAFLHQYQGNDPMVPATLLPVCDAGKRFSAEPEVAKFYELNCLPSFAP